MARDATIRVDLAVRGRDLIIAVTGARSIASIYAMMAVAGIRLVAAGDSGVLEILAPLKGQFVDQMLVGDEVTRLSQADTSDPLVRSRWAEMADVLTLNTSQRVLIVALLGVASLPFLLALNSSQLTATQFVPNVGWLVAPIVAAALVSLFPVRRGTLGGMVWVIMSWVVIGVVAGVSESILALLFEQSTEVEPPLLFNIVRGLLHYAIPGLLVFGARGLEQRARNDRDRLQTEVETGLEERARLLNESDLLERFIAEKLHRSIQGRLSAISLMLRLGRRQEALWELDILRQVTVPVLASQLQTAWKSPTSIFLDRAEIPAELAVTEAINASVFRTLALDQVMDIKRFAAECAVNAHRHGGNHVHRHSSARWWRCPSHLFERWCWYFTGPRTRSRVGPLRRGSRPPGGIVEIRSLV